MSRELVKMPKYFQNFIHQNDLWPKRGQTHPMPSPVAGFSVSCIQDDVRGDTIRSWCYIVNHYLHEEGGDLNYIRLKSKLRLTFKNEIDLTTFILRWS